MTTAFKSDRPQKPYRFDLKEFITWNGLQGQIIARRWLRTDSEACYLVKFVGRGTPKHLEESELLEGA